MKSEVINIKTPVSRVGNKTAILHILYALFPLHYGRFIDVFGGSGSVLLGKPTIDAFEVYNDFDRNLVNLFRCMKERTMATIRELGFCNLNSREDFMLLSSKIGPVLANNFPPQLLKNLFSVSEAPALIIKVQYLALMRQPVQQSCCEDSVAKKLRPAIKAFI